MGEHERASLDTVGAGFEAVLAGAAFGGYAGLLRGRDVGRAALSLVRNPVPAVTPLLDLARRLGAVGIGRGDDHQPGRIDRRFADPAWNEHPFLRRLALGYLAYGDAAMAIVDDLDLDAATRQRLRLLVDNMLAAAAPTNTLAWNPAAWKRVFDTGGGSLAHATRHLVSDARSPTRLPASVDRPAFEVGEDLAVTPGKVVRATPLYELIEYAPITEHVDAVPLLIVASPVNKYYLLDLEPKGSAIRAELAQGRRVFVVSWVNPDERHASAGFDAYVGAIVDALETVTEIAGAERAHLFGLCGGGLLAVIAAAYLAAGRRDLLATLTIGISVIDYAHDGESPVAFLDRRSADRAIASATRRGYFDARQTARAFALLRPVDGIWTSFVNNYVLGQAPPAVPLLHWSSDQTNLTAAFGRDLIELVLENRLATPGGVRVLGEDIDVGAISVDTYVLGASSDHITPWRDCYRTLALLSCETTFVLARGGHAVVVAKPAGAPRSSYRTGPVIGGSADAWLAACDEHAGTWWEHWNTWIAERAPDRVSAPDTLGSDAHPPLHDAPGDYVRRRLT